MRRHSRWFWLLSLAVLYVARPLGNPPGLAAAPQQQGDNLLQNPSFEGEYSPWGGIPQAQMPAGWTPWWADQSEGDPDWANHRPEWKPAEAVHYPGRVHSGERALQWHKSYATFFAGAYQQVSVPAYAQLRFSAYGQAWSCADYGLCHDGGGNVWSYEPANMSMRIGVDPTGQTNPWGPTVVWSGFGNPLDAWAYFQVDAAAQGSVVTVFLYSNPDWPKENQDVYFDDASLIVVGAAPPPTAPPTQAPPTSAPSTATAIAAAATAVPPTTVPFAPATPLPDGSLVHTVAAGETLWSIAVNYGVTMEHLRASNVIEEFIYEGQQLVIRPAAPAAPGDHEPAEAEEGGVGAGADEVETTSDERVAGDSEESAPIEAPEPEPVAAAMGAPAPEHAAGGAVCVTAFDDRNANGFRDAGEGLLAGVLITVSDDRQVVGNYTTDGASEPYCFSGLAAGVYQVAELLAGPWVATTGAAKDVSLRDGDVANLEFGNNASQPEEPGATRSESPSYEAQAASEDTIWLRLRYSVCTGGGVFGLLLMVGAGLFVLLSRRSKAFAGD